MKKLIHRFINKFKIDNSFKFVTLTFLLMNILSAYCLNAIRPYIHLVPSLVVGGILIIIGVLICILIVKNIKIAKILNVFLCILLIASSLLLTKFESYIANVLNNQETETVYIVAKADSKLTKDDAFISLNLGMVKSDVLGNNFGLEILKNNNKSGFKSIEYKNYDESYKDLMSGKTDIMIVSTYGLSDLLDKYGDKYTSSIKILLKDSKKLSLIENKPVDINSTGFTMLVSGVDLTSDNINEKGSSDVNILVSVNPNTKRFVMQVVPRDMWTKLACASGHSKLTYAGAWGGVDCSIKSLEDYFDIDINYYAKINFKGVTDLVDALGGIDVISDYEYCESGYCYKLGENHLDGDYALMFARIRHVLPGGDVARGKHQMEIINGVIKKFGANPSYDNLTSLLSTVESNFTTNFNKEDILKMYNLYTEMAPTLKIESYSIAGHTENAIDECTSEQLYYYYPDAGEKERVNKLIHDVVEGK